ncbi:unnamed protein product [Cuscuta epithymum]|uniref:Uncharacterized protein n=1 Tax=Cuscuta epithymum TaxID=186058 RepID=A0AAV0DZT3_9ASTE|nr:unnamed protein product [Cuscuta epithymum]
MASHVAIFIFFIFFFLFLFSFSSPFLLLSQFEQLPLSPSSISFIHHFFSPFFFFLSSPNSHPPVVVQSFTSPKIREKNPRRRTAGRLLLADRLSPAHESISLKSGKVVR